MRKILTLAAGLIIMTACAQKSQKAIVKSEPTTITWIEDKPGPTIQPQKLYPEVPDSLWAALGLEKGVPSSMSCLLLQTEGKTILLDAGLGAPFSQLLPKLKEKGAAPEELQLIYITHLHPDHIGGLLKEGKVVFPNAEVYVKHLHLFEAGDTLEGGVKSIAAYGHTPGHTVFQKDSILVIADLIHGAALQHQKHQRPERGIFSRSFNIIPTYKNV